MRPTALLLAAACSLLPSDGRGAAWAQRWEAPAGSRLRIHGAQPRPGGGTLLHGSWSDDATPFARCWIAAVDDQGAVEWQATYVTPSLEWSSIAFVTQLVPMPGAGWLALLGGSAASASVVALGPDGTPLWASSPSETLGLIGGVVADGHVVVAMDGVEGGAAGICSLDASTGTSEWCRAFKFESGLSDAGFRSVRPLDAGFVAHAWGTPWRRSSAYVTRFARDGAPLWTVSVEVPATIGVGDTLFVREDGSIEVESGGRIAVLAADGAAAGTRAAYPLAPPLGRAVSGSLAASLHATADGAVGLSVLDGTSVFRQASGLPAATQSVAWTADGDLLWTAADAAGGLVTVVPATSSSAGPCGPRLAETSWPLDGRPVDAPTVAAVEVPTDLSWSATTVRREPAPGVVRACAPCPGGFSWSFDRDGDTVADDCRPEEPSALDLRPGTVPFLVAKVPAGLAGAWEDVGAPAHDVLQAELSSVRSGAARFDPAACSVPATSAEWPALPGDRAYLVLSRSGSLTSSAGRTSEGAERTALPGCP